MAPPTPRQFLERYRTRETTRPHLPSAPNVQAERVPMANWLLAHDRIGSEAAFEQLLEDISDGTQRAPFVFAQPIADEIRLEWHSKFKGQDDL